MNKQEAWLEIAEAYSVHPEERKGRQWWVAHSGLCYAMDFLIPNTYNEIGRLYPSKLRMSYWCPIAHFEADDIRSLFCCLMAQLTDKEYEELLK